MASQRIQRKGYTEAGLRTLQRIAQDRHIRLENERIERLEAEFVAGYIGQIEAFLAFEAALGGDR